MKVAPKIVIFGRTNAGKSTLFNTLMEEKKALTSKIEGTTRDANIGRMEWDGRTLEFIDTGGIIEISNLLAGKKFKSADIDTQVQLKARDYLKQADLIIFLVDAKAGLLPQDKELAAFMKKKLAAKKILLVANKCDSAKDRNQAADFYQLNMGEPLQISAATGSGTGDLLDRINEVLKIEKNIKKSKFDDMPAEIQEEEVKVCLLGKPNVGKSSLLNAILGYERVIVSPVPHTTREPQDTKIAYQERTIKIIDTAGISKNGTKGGGLEKFGINKSLGVLSKADIALLVVDINEGITHQETKLAEEIISRKKNLIIIANKWDLIKTKDQKGYTDKIRSKLAFVAWAPIHFASALKGSKVSKILDLILEADKYRHVEIPAASLNTALMKFLKLHHPPLNPNHKRPYISQLIQSYVNPPEFTITVRTHDVIPDSYMRFLENRIRDYFHINGTPITIKVNRGKRVHGKHEALNPPK